MKEFMTYEMALLESEMTGEQRGIQIGRTEGTEAVAIKLIRRGRPLQEIHEDTGLPLERIHELEKISLNS